MLKNEGIFPPYTSSNDPLTKDPSPERSNTSGLKPSKFLTLFWKKILWDFGYILSVINQLDICSLLMLISYRYILSVINLSCLNLVTNSFLLQFCNNCNMLGYFHHILCLQVTGDATLGLFAIRWLPTFYYKFVITYICKDSINKSFVTLQCGSTVNICMLQKDKFML